MFSEILFEPTVFIYSMKYVGFAISDFRGSDFMPAVVEQNSSNASASTIFISNLNEHMEIKVGNLAIGAGVSLP